MVAAALSCLGRRCRRVPRGPRRGGARESLRHESVSVVGCASRNGITARPGSAPVMISPWEAASTTMPVARADDRQHLEGVAGDRLAHPRGCVARWSSRVNMLAQPRSIAGSKRTNFSSITSSTLSSCWRRGGGRGARSRRVDRRERPAGAGRDERSERSTDRRRLHRARKGSSAAETGGRRTRAWRRRRSRRKLRTARSEHQRRRAHEADLQLTPCDAAKPCGGQCRFVVGGDRRARLGEKGLAVGRQLDAVAIVQRAARSRSRLPVRRSLAAERPGAPGRAAGRRA